MTMAPAMALALDASFGSVERWREAFVAMAVAQALRDGPGWARLEFEPHAGTLVNRWAARHTQAVAGGEPILALDMAEPARAAHGAAAAAACAEAFMGTIDWATAHGRYQQAVHAASEAFGASPDEIGGAQVLDVRRAGAFAQARTMLPGARWRDPATVATWAAELPAGREVLVYCVYGHEVSRATALRLRAAGINARYLRGGIDAWQAAQRPLVDKPAGPMP